MSKLNLRQTWFLWLSFLLLVGFFLFATIKINTPRLVSENSPRVGDSYVKKINFWDKHFTEPIEILYFRFNDETGFGVTSYSDTCVEGYESVLVDYIIAHGRRVEDIGAIIHNHLYSFTFSDRDIRFVVYFRDKGFKGKFLLYQPTGHVIDYDKRW